MAQNQTNQKIKTRDSIIVLLSIIGLAACIAVLFPQVRQMMMDYIAKHVIHKETSLNQVWDKLFSSFAMFGFCFILFFDYIVLTNSGKSLVKQLKQDIKDCLSEFDYRSFLKPSLVLLGVYLLGILTIIRANFLYKDDIWRAADGSRQWFNWSRYVSEFLSIFVHGDTNLTDISPVPQLLAILILFVSSVLLVYIIGNRKITVVRLLASIPLGLSPYILESLAFKFDAPYMALSVLASIFPFLFITRKKAFIFVSIVSLLIVCMSYQSATGIYLLIVVMICFQDWNSRKKSYKEIFSFLGIAALAFSSAMLIFRFFLMKPIDSYASTAIHPFPHLISGTLSNIKSFILLLNHDLGMIWKIGIAIVILFFITKSINRSAQSKLLSFFVSLLILIISLISSYGVYFLLEVPSFRPCAFMGFGAFLAILGIYIVSDYKKVATVAVLALNWCLFVFAFSYGNALADQARYAEFRISILLQDLSTLYPDVNTENNKSIQFDNSIDFTPSVKNIAKHYPVIERLVPPRLSDFILDYYYFLVYFNYARFQINNQDNLDLPEQNFVNFNTLNLPVVLDSYYHTIRSDGNHILIVLKH